MNEETTKRRNVSGVFLFLGWMVFAMILIINKIPPSPLNVGLFVLGLLLTELPIWIMTDGERKPTPNK